MRLDSSLHFLALSLAGAQTAQGYQPYPFNPYDKTHVSRLRSRLDSFHENLSRGKIGAIAAMTAPDVFWNYKGTLLIKQY